MNVGLMPLVSPPMGHPIPHRSFRFACEPAWIVWDADE